MRRWRLFTLLYHYPLCYTFLCAVCILLGHSVQIDHLQLPLTSLEVSRRVLCDELYPA
ncbi:uncharacterized protein LAESUDRAFT_725177 [Laetiporus sulphureus 93-53]|uniref:Uncharacterized protein n=1 Tax=Laetiporus sulphureus 93-53 TaxID=1314785 RepID=A0A165EKU0_9APHY|nr:uncharacterized protein LAESUDRAFT_725177 [Laetiporus sulphureus 93-53]KZT07267.1 hypothetical protein LAESUDRAFT_725177 [Laetiporus sulphureus 93-53]